MDRYAAPVSTILEAPIIFTGANGDSTHAPLAQFELGGSTIRLILDTGSTDHLLTVELADRLGLPREAGEAGTDSAGDSVPSWTLGTVPVRIGGEELRLENVIAINAPAPFEAMGIGGILSPQHLHPSAQVVLDLVDERLTLLDADPSQVDEQVRARHPEMRSLSLERARDDSTILVHAAVDGFDPVVTMLDTGGKRTEFFHTAVPGLQGGERKPTGHGVGGGQTFGMEVAGASLRVGGVELSVPSLLVREKPSNAPGVVGMDLLRETVLVVSADPGRDVLWLVP